MHLEGKRSKIGVIVFYLAVLDLLIGLECQYLTF